MPHHANLSSFKKGITPWNKGINYSEEIRVTMRGPRPSVAGSNNPMYGKHRTQEVKDAISKAQKERFRDPEERRKASDLNKGRTQSEETKRKKSEALKGKPAWNAKPLIQQVCPQCGKIFMARDTHRRHKLCSRTCTDLHTRKRYQDPNERLKDSQAVKLAYQNNPSLRHRQSVVHKKLWQDPDYRERALKAILSGAHKRPTKPEKYLDAIIREHFPQYRYNGDGGLGIMLGGFIPDFPNVNGKKDLIEVFGDYYHSSKFLKDKWQGSELGKIMIYNSLGWRCLVIWEHELKELTEDEIVEKIKRFSGRRYAHATHT